LFTFKQWPGVKRLRNSFRYSWQIHYPAVFLHRRIKDSEEKTGSEIIISLIKQIQAFPAGKITTPVFSIFLKFG
jgi:hypothetical protein